MNYKELLDSFYLFTQNHKQVKLFGYGTISDIEVPTDLLTGEKLDRDYPYMFFNPTNHTLGENQITYRFNLIVMQLINPDTPTGFSEFQATIKAQNDCLLILNDFLAWIEYTQDYQFDLVRTTSVTPFKERFNDNIAGVTGTIELVMRNTLDLCNAPLRPFLITPFIHVTRAASQIIGSDPEDNESLTAGTYILNPGNEWNVNRLVPTSLRTYRVVVAMRLKTIEGTGDIIPQPFWIEQRTGSPQPKYTPDTVTGWPTSNDGIERTVTLTWNSVSLTPAQWQFITLYDSPGVEANFEVTDLDIKFYI